MKVLDKGFVDLMDFMGGDQRVVEAARVSFDLETLQMGAKEEKLINYLMKHRHGSPFEHTYFTFHVKAPLFVVREWQRHRIGSYNEMSGRYVEFEPEFYLPTRLRIAADTNKQGSKFPDEEFLTNWTDENGAYLSPTTGEYMKYNWHEEMSVELQSAYVNAYTTYEALMENGVAKEMARMVLPLSLYTQFYWTVNARSLMNFLNLRTGIDAQWEIRQYAETIKDIFKERMPVTYDAWEANNWLAP